MLPLQVVPPDFLPKLSNLLTLNLSHNEITALPASIGKLG